MSDKFFFNGRQDPRRDHAGAVYRSSAGHKAGSKKYPLALVVTSKARKKKVASLVEKAQLHADITIDSSEGAEESIAELEALLNKSDTVKVEKSPARNDPCNCGSGKKYKKCCGAG